jgi:hypothetical protein
MGRVCNRSDVACEAHAAPALTAFMGAIKGYLEKFPIDEKP